eukprot:1162384-Pyramimonas_sp.AAC.1
MSAVDALGCVQFSLRWRYGMLIRKISHRVCCRLLSLQIALACTIRCTKTVTPSPRQSGVFC